MPCHRVLARTPIRPSQPWFVGTILILLLATDAAAFAPTKLELNPRWLAHSPPWSKNERGGRAETRRNPHVVLPSPMTALPAMGEESAARQAAAQLIRRATNIPAFVFALNSSTKWIVTLAHTLAVWCRPWAYTGPFIVVGSIGAVYLTDALKKIINQGRPEGAPFADPGMPSSHSLVSFFAAAAWASVLDATVPSGGRALLVGAAALIAVLRVICGYHSVAQVAVGAGLGSVLGRGWALLGEILHASDPRLVLSLAWGCYLGGSAFFIRKNMRHWVGRDLHI